jgi:hypothetical protein
MEDAHAYLMETLENLLTPSSGYLDPIEGGPGMMLYTKELYEHALTRRTNR